MSRRRTTSETRQLSPHAPRTVTAARAQLAALRGATSLLMALPRGASYPCSPIR